MKNFQIAVFLMFCISVFVSCSDDGITTPTDYREEFIGIYDCTKSNRSFDDPIPIEIEVTVIIDSSSFNMIFVNDFLIEIDDDGTFLEGGLDGSIIDDEIKFKDSPFILGQVIPCFVQGTKRN